MTRVARRIVAQGRRRGGGNRVSAAKTGWCVAFGVRAVQGVRCHGTTLKAAYQWGHDLSTSAGSIVHEIESAECAGSHGSVESGSSDSDIIALHSRTCSTLSPACEASRSQARAHLASLSSSDPRIASSEAPSSLPSNSSGVSGSGSSWQHPKWGNKLIVRRTAWRRAQRERMQQLQRELLRASSAVGVVPTTTCLTPARWSNANRANLTQEKRHTETDPSPSPSSAQRAAKPPSLCYVTDMLHSRALIACLSGGVLLSACRPPTEGDSGSESSGVPTTETTGMSTTGAPTTGTGTTSGDLNACGDLNAARHQNDEIYCACATEAKLYQDVDACIASLQAEGQQWLDCMCELESSDPMHAEYIECWAEAEAGYAMCTKSIDCSDLLSLGESESQCNSAFLGALHICYKTSKEAVLAEEECVDGVPPFTCGSGEPVPHVYLCDGEPDCMDMSDETGELCRG